MEGGENEKKKYHLVRFDISSFLLYGQSDLFYVGLGNKAHKF